MGTTWRGLNSLIDLFIYLFFCLTVSSNDKLVSYIIKLVSVFVQL